MPELYELDGPLLVLAGPGTGKTYALGRRVKYLVEERGVDPQQVCVITFTVPAAAEMRRRLSDHQRGLYVAPNLRPRNIRTMHSLGYQIIAEQASSIGLPEFVNVVESGSTCRILLEDAAQLAGLTRADCEATRTCRMLGDCRPTGQKCEVCSAYKRILRACGSIDYDDQIMLACDLLSRDGALLDRYRDRARHLLVDEYQDINAAQFRLIELLAQGQADGLFVVGDDDQSIYSWRGGSPQFIRSFKHHFGDGADVVSLTHCRRCHPNVMAAAVAVVKTYDPDRIDKGELTYDSPDGPKVRVHQLPSDRAEAETIARIAVAALGETPPRSLLILVPTKDHASAIIREMKSRRIPHSAFETSPGEGLPLLLRLADWLTDTDNSLALRILLEAMINSGLLGVPSARSRTGGKLAQREEAFRHVSRLWDAVMEDGTPLWRVLQAARHNADILGSLCEAAEDLSQLDAERVPELLRMAADFLKPWKTCDALFTEIGGWVAAARSTTVNESGTARVMVMTLQGAKGLEADVTCVVGLEEGTMPRTDDQMAGLAEQSRLMYVSMTRAKRDLHLFSVRQRPGRVSKRSVHGPGGLHRLEPSRFLEALPKDAVEVKFRRSKH